MNPQPKTKDQQDHRHERLRHAERTGEYVDFPGGGGIPMEVVDGRVRCVPKSLAAEKRRRNIRMGRSNIEHGNERDS
ncbi:hypothetical protein LCGC14_0377160 [marine sediment metagenome]|uniref:Uncharacterized protein n=1 Tax=marine sediment metagenome TaxID=412755 RepID=A0A0F9T3M2_9ZZZZ